MTNKRTNSGGSTIVEKIHIYTVDSLLLACFVFDGYSFYNNAMMVMVV